MNWLRSLLPLFFGLCLSAYAHEGFSIHLDSAQDAVQETVQSISALKDWGSRDKLKVTIAVSSSLHPDYIKDLARSCAEVNDEARMCRLVVRGIAVEFTKDADFFSLSKKEQSAMQEQMRRGITRLSELTLPMGAEIDPMFFRRFDIRAVPVFVFERFKDQKLLAAGVVRGAVTLDAAFEEAMKHSEDIVRSTQ